MPGTEPTPWTVTRAWGVHLFTSFGVVCSFAAIIEALSDNAPAALIWLIVAQVVDGIDGPLARGYDVGRSVPVLSGHTLDLVVDYTTCAFAPAIFAWQFELIPEPWDVPLLGLVLMTSALWFSRDDIETRDLWFRGFPTSWHFVFTVFWVIDAPGWLSVTATLVLSIVTLTPWLKLPHVLGAPQFRAQTVTLSVIALACTLLLVINPDTELRPMALAMMALWVLWYFGIGIWRSLQGDEIVEAEAPVAPVPVALDV